MEFIFIEKFVLATLIFLSFLSFSLEIYKKYKIIMKGKGNFSFEKPLIRFKRVFDEVDVLLTPTAPNTAFPIDKEIKT